MNFPNVVLYEISGCGCAGCELLAPEARAVAEELGLPFTRIDGETCGETRGKWKIERVPAIVLADGDAIIFKCYGYQPREILATVIEDKLNAYLEERQK